jgi:hypothetical protein
MFRRILQSVTVVLTVSLAACCLAIGDQKGPGEIVFQQRGEVFLVNGNASGLARHGDYLYLVLNESTHPLVVYDIGKPSEPRVVRHLPAPGWPMRCRIIAPGWLWTVHGNGEGFFDLRDPAHPKLVTDASIGPPLRHVSRQTFRVHPNFTYTSCAWENVLYYGTERQTTAIYDIAQPQNPKLLAELEHGVPVALDGKWLFVAGKAAAVQVYDVTEPAKPKLVGRVIQQDDWPFALRGSAVAMEGDRLYVGIRRDLPRLFGRGPFEQAQTGVAVLDVRDWRNPRLLGHAWVEDAISDITTLACKDGYVFASDAAFGLRVFDAREPKRIQLVAGDRQGGELSAAVLLPKRRLLALGQNLSGSVFLVDIREAAKPQLLGYFHHGLRVWGQMASSADERYVYFQADISRPRPGFSALFTLDIQEPSKPRLVSVVPDVSRAYGLVRVGTICTAAAATFSTCVNPINRGSSASGYRPAVTRSPTATDTSTWGNLPTAMVRVGSTSSAWPSRRSRSWSASWLCRSGIASSAWLSWTNTCTWAGRNERVADGLADWSSKWMSPILKIRVSSAASIRRRTCTSPAIIARSGVTATGSSWGAITARLACTM